MRVGELLLLLANLALRSTCSEMVDRASFIVKSSSRQLFDFGVHSAVLTNDCESAVSALVQSFQLYPLKATAQELSSCFHRLQRTDAASHWSRVAAEVDHKGSVVRQAEELIRQSRRSTTEDDVAGALRHAALALDTDPGNAYAAYLSGVQLQRMGDVAGAVDSYLTAVEISPDYAKGRINAAAMYQSVNDFASAIAHYRHLLENVFGVEDVGSDLFCMAKANIGVAYFQAGQPRNAIRHLTELCDTLSLLLVQSCPSVVKKFPFPRHRIGNSKFSMLEGTARDGHMCDDFFGNLGVAMMHLTTVKKSVCDWKDMEMNVFGFLLPASLHNFDRFLNNSDDVAFGPILPFDSLLLPVGLEHKLKIATLRSLSISKTAPVVSNDGTRGSLFKAVATTATNDAQKTKLRLGFMSYDFGDHPTAHLIEALFETVAECRLEVNGVGMSRRMCNDVHMGILNYGPTEDSEYRHRLMQKSDSMYDMPLQSHLESVQWIQKDGIDILLDLQLHTLGNRAEIVAAHPAPLVVNYLVYPGTCGSKQHEYIIADKIVVPPEHSVFYSEKLLLLPPSYQISTYKNINASLTIRNCSVGDGNEQEMERTLKLCNFNKIDKLDVESLTLWTQIMRRFPRSRLQLLDPVKKNDFSGIVSEFEQSSSSADHVKMHMKYHGVFGGDAAGHNIPRTMNVNARLEIVPRMRKEDHIKRQSGSDLFLDTVVYGAHSTATDALRAGLPVLTLHGDSFPSRVATSLYRSFDPDDDIAVSQNTGDRLPPAITLEDVLVGYSQKEFEDMAVHLLSSKNTIRRLKNELAFRVTSEQGIFDSEKHAFNFLHGMESIAEIKAMSKSSESAAGQLPHVICTNSCMRECSRRDGQ